ncbi:MAG: DUF1266 domain-containing protein [Alphaproteobacteria bacterium]|nr:DUF1266 domain-containing protein [Alphaproteobacteria bacterium]
MEGVAVGVAVLGAVLAGLSAIGAGGAGLMVLWSRRAVARPGDAWLEGACSLVGGFPGGGAVAAREALDGGWGVVTADEAFALADELTWRTDAVAWSRVRALWVLRRAVEAGWLDADEGRERARALAAELRERFGSWEELAAAVAAERAAIVGESPPVVIPRVPWDTPLS